MKQSAVIVCDIGKTNAKICAVTSDGNILYANERNFTSCSGPPYTHLDVTGIWAWLISELQQCAPKFAINKIIPSAHGATCALIDDADLVLPVLDYEDSGPDQCEDVYAQIRPPFTETLSPPLPGGLNYGRGIFWIAQTFPDQFARVRNILNYAQYWSYKLSGAVAGEISSIGSHSDLWAPKAQTYSSLVGKMNWQHLFPALRKADEVLATIHPDVARDTGLDITCQVLCGIHDSNATLLPWLDRPQPFTLSSTGTWIINLAVGSSLDGLVPEFDCAANVSMHGTPIASSRWMGGREFANLTAGQDVTCDFDALRECINLDAMYLPPQGGQGGPFQHCAPGRNANLTKLSPQLLASAATLYCAMVQDYCLDLSSPEGPIIVTGPFAGNELFLGTLATLRANQQIWACPSMTDSASGAAYLAYPDLGAPQLSQITPFADDNALQQYRQLWRQRARA